MPNTLTNMAAKAAGDHIPSLRAVGEYVPHLEQNVGDADRLLSLAVGGFLTVSGLTGRRVSLLSTVIGGCFLYRAFSGHCPVMQSFGISSRCGGHGSSASVIEAGGGVRIEHSITINKPREELYRFWRNFENLPRIMSHLREVKQTGANRSHWVTRGPLGMNVEWDAEIINDRPNETIAWRSLEASDIDTAGSVHFNDSANKGWTEVRVNLKYDPPAGKLGAAAAWLFGEEPCHQVRDDLARFKEFMEGGQTSTVAKQPARQPNGNR